MNKEEFDKAYQRAKGQYVQAMDLMAKDAPFMENLPERINTLLAKIKSLIEDAAKSKTGYELVGKIEELKDIVVCLAVLDKQVMGFFEETTEDWKHLSVLMKTYTEHSFPGENLPKSKDGATEWVTQLEETAAELLRTYTSLNKRIIPIRQEFNSLMMATHPYLN